MVKSMPAMWETWVQSLGWEDPLEKEMATHSSTLAWRIPWTESLVSYSSWGGKELDTTEQLLSLEQIKVDTRQKTPSLPTSYARPLISIRDLLRHFTTVC